MRIASGQLPVASLQDRLNEIRETPEAQKELKKLDKATRDVEAVFMKMLIGQMRKTGMQGMLGNGQEAQMYNDFLDDAVAQEVSRGGGVGIGKLLYNRMSDALLRQMTATESSTRGRVEEATPGSTRGRVEDIAFPRTEESELKTNFRGGLTNENR